MAFLARITGINAALRSGGQITGKVTDAVSKNRTDGALVRVITPIANNEPAAQARLVSFTQSLFPQLDEIIPR